GHPGEEETPGLGWGVQGRWGGGHLDAGAAALAHGVGHGGARRVDHGHEPHEAEVVGGEVDVVAVEGEALGVLLLGQVEVAETWRGDVA
uniref:Uncharacterized protein n=1 Tax=Nothoprocta perdicaria TaxID=30464 RepID=A0A8C6Z9J7_NOTPE